MARWCLFLFNVWRYIRKRHRCSLKVVRVSTVPINASCTRVHLHWMIANAKATAILQSAKFQVGIHSICYRPQQSCGKVMFSQASVSQGGGVVSGNTPPGRHPVQSSACWDTYCPAQCMLGYTPPAQCMLGYTPISHCSRWYTSYWNAFLFTLLAFVVIWRI